METLKFIFDLITSMQINRDAIYTYERGNSLLEGINL